MVKDGAKEGFRVVSAPEYEPGDRKKNGRSDSGI